MIAPTSGAVAVFSVSQRTPAAKASTASSLLPLTALNL